MPPWKFDNQNRFLFYSAGIYNGQIITDLFSHAKSFELYPEANEKWLK